MKKKIFDFKLSEYQKNQLATLKQKGSYSFSSKKQRGSIQKTHDKLKEHELVEGDSWEDAQITFAGRIYVYNEDLSTTVPEKRMSEKERDKLYRAYFSKKKRSG